MYPTRPSRQCGPGSRCASMPTPHAASPSPAGLSITAATIDPSGERGRQRVGARLLPPEARLPAHRRHHHLAEPHQLRDVVEGRSPYLCHPASCPTRPDVVQDWSGMRTWHCTDVAEWTRWQGCACRRCWTRRRTWCGTTSPTWPATWSGWPTPGRSGSCRRRRSGVGTRFECDTKIGPITLTDVMEITEWKPGKAMGVRHTGLITGTRPLHPPQGAPRAHPLPVEGAADLPGAAGRALRRVHQQAGAALGVEAQPPPPRGPVLDAVTGDEDRGDEGGGAEADHRARGWRGRP